MHARTGYIPTGLVTGYLISILLVPIYVQMYPVWSVFNDALPARVMQALPVVITMVLLGVTLLAYRSLIKQGERTVRTWAVLAGVLLCLTALALPDPQVPVKRIHVVEYLVLSVLVRFAMSFRLQGITLLIFSGFFGALLGIQDEFLQGMHPARTYGLRDMAVNGLSSFGGALIWHGMNLFRRDVGPVDKTPHRTRESVLYLFWLTLSILAMVLPLVYYRGSSVPLWPAAPLVGSMVFFLLSWNHFFRPWKHGIIAVSLVAFCLVFYPLVASFWPLEFY